MNTAPRGTRCSFKHNNMKKHIYTFALFLLLGLGTVIAQNGLEKFQTLMAKTEAYYQEREHYTYDVSYAFYNEGTAIPAEELTGKVHKNGKHYYSKIGNTEFLYAAHEFVKVNHDEQAILYSSIEETQNFTPVQLNGLMGHFERIKTIKKGNEIRCEITFKKNPSMPYSGMSLVLDAKTHALKKQELFLLEGKVYPWMSSGLKRTEAGKIAISFREKETEKQGIKISNYIDKSSGIALTQQFNNYKLYNTTL